MRAKTVVSWAIVALLLAGWAMFLRPPALGGTAGYVIVSGASMQPEMHTGDLVITAQEKSYERGDIVAFRVPDGDPAAGSMVIHRVIGGNPTDGYITKGDNREQADQWRPTTEDVQGRMRFMIPKAGVLVALLRTPLGIALLAALLVFGVIVFDRSKSDTESESALEKLGGGDGGDGGAGKPIHGSHHTQTLRASKVGHKL